MSGNQKRNLPILVLGLFALGVWFLNFKPQYWLTGWDNLHPEFNFGLNIKRSIFAPWQEYQGLGLLGGMGYASDLPRQIILAILSIFFPLHWLRPFWVFLMLLIGPIGVYFLLKYIFSINSTSEESLRNTSEVCGVAFFGAIFYLFNLATVQFFYVPFEAFVTHYGFLPWLIFLVLSYLKTGSKRVLLLFFLVSFLSTTQFYVTPLFIVYFLSLFLVSFGIFLKEKSKSVLRRIFFIFLITFLVNSFWLLPFLYFSATSASVVGEAQENFMATENIFLRNKEFGKISDVALLRGFWFEFTDFTKEGKLDYMVKSWRNHLSSPIVLGLGYFQFAVILVGIISQIAKKQKHSSSLFLLFLFPFIILANDTPGLSLIVQFLQSKIPLFWQVFRVPFTKFAILAAFSYSIFFGLGIFYVFSKIKKLFRFAKETLGLVVIITTLVFIWPIFEGNLIYEFNQLKIPQEYFELFDFFKEKPLARIANFPQHSFWGWNYHSWGNVGSGFLWYGNQQPILDRAFDGYSRFNENYYWEISKALYSQNLPLFEKVLEKYQISWLLLDGNVVSYTSPKSLYLEELEELISNSSKVKFATSFGKIKIYQVLLETKPKDFVFLAQDLPEIGAIYKWNNYDKGYLEYENYISKENYSTKKSAFADLVHLTGSLKDWTLNLKKRISLNTDFVKRQFNIGVDLPRIEPGRFGLRVQSSEPARPTPKLAYQENENSVKVLYPFRSLFTGRRQEEMEVKIEEKDNYFVFKTKIPKELVGGELILPEIEEIEITEIDEKDLTKKRVLPPRIYLDGELISVNSTSEESPPEAGPPSEVFLSYIFLSYIKEGNFEVWVPKIKGLMSYDSLNDENFLKKVAQTCDAFNKGKYSLEKVKEEKEFLKFSTTDSSSCLDINLPNLENRLGYLITTESRYREGKSLLFWLENLQSRKADIETYLPKFTSEESPPEAGPPSEVFNTSYFVQPPMAQDGLGYSLHFNNISIGRVKSVNELAKVAVSPIPYKFLTGIKVVKDTFHLPGAPQVQPHLEGVNNIKVEHSNESFYKVEIPPSFAEASEGKPNTYLILSQAFSKDWLAFEKAGRFSFRKLKDHVLVNNWANGWGIGDQWSVTSDQSPVTIYIFFWPQLLEYLGFIFLLVTPLIIWKLPLDKCITI